MKQTANKRQLAKLIQQVERLAPADKPLNIMEVCGAHTMAIGKSGLRQLLPDNIRLLSGPGCPVCVTHDCEIEVYLELARQRNVIIATFGDLLRVPGKKGSSLADARGQGAKVSVVYSTLDALKLAKKNPGKEVVFLGAGFETTAPTVAMSVIQAQEEGIENFSVYSLHKLVPPALEALLLDKEVKIDGFILPGHVSTIIGVEPYYFLAREYHKASVITGFETHDILQGLVMLLEQIREDNPCVEIQYRRGVLPQGTPLARQVMARVFEPADAWWRGLGLIPKSGLRIRESFRNYDANKKFNIPEPYPNEKEESNKNCACGDILKGIKLPQECRLFGRACTPLNPVGPCMVSSEGACAAYYRFTEIGGG
ncbi:hydrogenase formation protein HypD [Desulforamulus profundi]|uniref:Hydrogenase formation protein HypD n=1 Tax=Desulforamulus profundi TaxID=1383067 RepID=A0A2C6MBY4_9FIRM|nr:hydrogenase formation protein HypD [Desulforamulus profundi]PHJ37558.1 hydrogenase formation protein HypD [Desulforamulus profundi]